MSRERDDFDTVWDSSVLDSLDDLADEALDGEAFVTVEEHEERRDD